MTSNNFAECELPANTATAYALLTSKSAIQESYEGRDGVKVSVRKTDFGHLILVTRPVKIGPIKTTLRLAQHWRSDEVAGNSADSYIADIDYRLLATPISISGLMQLQPTETGSKLSAVLESRVAIPVLGLALSPLLAKLVAGKLQADLEYQRELLVAGH